MKSCRRHLEPSITDDVKAPAQKVNEMTPEEFERYSAVTKDGDEGGR